MAQLRLTDALGRVLGGRYRLIAPLGVGASAQVFLADDVRLRRRVAVKMLHAALADDHDFLRRFQAEARSAAALNHPHIMAVYDWGQDDVPYLVLEYLAGGSVRGMLDKGWRLSPSQALRVGLEAARALEYAHSRGLVHRDIKPANLLFGEEGRLRIADFGLARALAEAAWTEPQGAVLGTARYAAPEQAQGERLDGKADVYALALVLVEAVTGHVPFAADTTIGTLMARVHDPLDPPEALGPLREPLARAGTTDPADRLDARGLVVALMAAARELTAPKPLPLAGTAASDPAVPLVDANPTAIPTSNTAQPGDDDATVGAPLSVLEADDDPRDVIAADATTQGDALEPPEPAEPPKPPKPPEPLDGADLVADTGPKRRSRWRKAMWAIVAVLILVAVAVGGVVGYRSVAAKPAHPVPSSLIGLTQADALTKVQALKFDWKTQVVHARKDGSTPGTVIATRPATGKKLTEGSRLTLVISDGNTLVNVPGDVVGKTFDDAKAELAAPNLDLVAQSKLQSDETAPKGAVLKLADGTPPQLAKGSAITLIVSDGPAPRTIPDTAKLTP
ncbi:MAG: protein kinase, partial [Acidimicrobiales bacterium]